MALAWLFIALWALTLVLVFFIILNWTQTIITIKMSTHHAHGVKKEKKKQTNKKKKRKKM